MEKNPPKWRILWKRVWELLWKFLGVSCCFAGSNGARAIAPRQCHPAHKIRATNVNNVRVISSSSSSMTIIPISNMPQLINLFSNHSALPLTMCSARGRDWGSWEHSPPQHYQSSTAPQSMHFQEMKIKLKPRTNPSSARFPHLLSDSAAIFSDTAKKQLWNFQQWCGGTRHSMREKFLAFKALLGCWTDTCWPR